MARVPFKEVGWKHEVEAPPEDSRSYLKAKHYGTWCAVARQLEILKGTP